MHTVTVQLNINRGKCLARHYEVITWALRRRGAWSVHSIVEELQMEIRSAYRYIAAMSEAGIIWEVGKADLSRPHTTLWRSRYSMMLRSDVQQKDDVLELNRRPGCIMRVAAPTIPLGTVVVRVVNSKQQKR